VASWSQRIRHHETFDTSAAHRRGRYSQGDCPEEGDYLTLPYGGQEHRYQVTFSNVNRDRPYVFVAPVVRDPLPAGMELP
jgi:hypothetical protein